MMNNSSCKHCDEFIVQKGFGGVWVHYPLLNEECDPKPVAEPKRNERGEVISLLTK